VTRRLDPARHDAGLRLRTARLRRGLTQTTLAGLASLSPAYISMIETGQRDLTRVSDILALADVLNVSPLYLADGRTDTPTPGQRPAGPHPPQAVPFPARPDPRTLARHQHLAHQFTTLAQHDRRAAGDWLRRLARDPTVSPWLLLDQLPNPPAATTTPTPAGSTPPAAPTLSLHGNGPR
jgi:transcriptional regulator with XRE-family HTH domain